MRSVSRFLAILVVSILSLACGSQAPPPGAAPASAEAVPPPAAPRDPLPPSEEGALARLEKSSDSLADLCYTSNLRRSHHEARFAVTCRSTAA